MHYASQEQKSLAQKQNKLMGHTLESALHYPYLGVELSSTLDWSHHIDNKVNKANKTLGFLRRNLSNCPESINKLISF